MQHSGASCPVFRHRQSESRRLTLRTIEIFHRRFDSRTFSMPGRCQADGNWAFGHTYMGSPMIQDSGNIQQRLGSTTKAIGVGGGNRFAVQTQTGLLQRHEADVGLVHLPSSKFSKRERPIVLMPSSVRVSSWTTGSAVSRIPKPTADGLKRECSLCL